VYHYISVDGFAGNLEVQGSKVVAIALAMALFGYEICSPPQTPKRRKKGLLWFRRPEGPYWNTPVGGQLKLL